MHPRTLILLVALILLTSFGLRLVVFQTGVLPVSEEGILREAVGLSLTYSVGGQVKTLMVDRPEELEGLFTVLRLHRAEGRQNDVVVWKGAPVGGAVTFRFPDRTTRQMHFQSRGWLGEFEVDPRFYERLSFLASRAEGRRIDLLEDNPGVKRGP